LTTIDCDIRLNFSGHFFEIGLIDVFEPEMKSVRGVLMYLDNSKSFDDLMIEHIDKFKPAYLSNSWLQIYISHSEQEIFEFHKNLYWKS
jgi:hypothetical protein